MLEKFGLAAVLVLGLAIIGIGTALWFSRIDKWVMPGIIMVSCGAVILVSVIVGASVYIKRASTPDPGLSESNQSIEG